jgi:hypothetical protein
MSFARNAGPLLVSAVFSVAAAYHFLDLSSGTRVIVDEHSFPRMKHSLTRFNAQDCLSVCASDQGQA